MTVAAAPEVRAAQRRIVGTINAFGKLNKDGLAMWREVNCGEWKATAADIGRALELLEVPHTIVTAFRFPLARATYEFSPGPTLSTTILRGCRVRE